MEPMLAVAVKKLPIRFPVFASPKIDGVRSWWPGGRTLASPLSRRMKPFPNAAANGMFTRDELHGLDGEFTLGSPTAPDVFRKTSAVLMSQSAPAIGLVLNVFDDLSRGADAPFTERLLSMQARGPNLPGDLVSRVNIVEQVFVRNEDELREREMFWLSLGYEGAMIRDPKSPYKFGRSTEKEGYLLKVKRFEDCEATIEGVFEQQHNENEAVRDERGFTKRSSCQEGKTGASVLGGLQVRATNGPFEGVAFEVGSGFDAATRAELWELREELFGKIVKVKFFPTGSKDKPRFPTFLGFRAVEVDG